MSHAVCSSASDEKIITGRLDAPLDADTPHIYFFFVLGEIIRQASLLARKDLEISIARTRRARVGTHFFVCPLGDFAQLLVSAIALLPDGPWSGRVIIIPGWDCVRGLIIAHLLEGFSLHSAEERVKMKMRL